MYSQNIRINCETPPVAALCVILNLQKRPEGWTEQHREEAGGCIVTLLASPHPETLKLKTDETEDRKFIKKNQEMRLSTESLLNFVQMQRSILC